LTRITSGRQTTAFSDPAGATRAVILVLDLDVLQRQILDPLVAKHFGERGATDYLVTIVRRDDPSVVVYSSGTTPVDASTAEVTSGLFDLRMDELNRLAGDHGDTHAGTGPRERVTITVVRRADGTEGQRVLMAGGDQQGGWQIRARHRSGSLDAIVARSRRRNVGISLGVLGLLTASVVLIIAAAQRQRRLARQQMEFVAAVSHELRTPLAVICSAGDNLADGVVADATQVQRYGALIQTEGRRLRDLVERVMEFAGITSATLSATARSRTEVDLSNVVADAVSGVAADAEARNVRIEVRAPGTLPAVFGDADGLRSAMQNILANAVKYSPGGASIDVSAEAHGQGIRIQVADRGLGIDADDIPNIFKPFYRGRRAMDAQVRGTGVGLSVVRHVIDAHRGRIGVESRPGEGTTVTVDLPAATPVAGAANGQPRDAAADTTVPTFGVAGRR
jgi:signal transduction histidine kinase